MKQPTPAQVQKSLRRVKTILPSEWLRNCVSDDVAVLCEALEAAEQRARSAEAIVRQVARDTYGRDMTPKEFADAAGYDS